MRVHDGRLVCHHERLSLSAASSRQLLEIRMEHTRELLSVSLSDLLPSPVNVCRRSPGRVDDGSADQSARFTPFADRHRAHR